MATLHLEKSEYNETIHQNKDFPATVRDVFEINSFLCGIKYLAVPATSAPSERIWSRAARVLTVKRNRMKEDVTAAVMYCRENKHILHKHYTEIAKEMMH